MADYYADSSVLVKRHVDERGSDWFRALANSASGNIILTARLSLIEVYSAPNRRVREGQIDPADYALIAGDFTAVCANEYELIELTPGIVERARQLLERHPLRAYDAVQVATALSTNETLVAGRMPPLIFLAADDRMLNAARAEGLPTDNPNSHP